MISEKMVFPIKGSPILVWGKISRIGGDYGWYYGTILWKIRGFLDQLAGGTGYRKGRRDPDKLKEGDPIDFWRVEIVDAKTQTLRLKAEMKLPGEVFLQWEINQNQLLQTIEFFLTSMMGKTYWFLVRPLHYWVFYQMGKRITEPQYKKSPH